MARSHRLLCLRCLTVGTATRGYRAKSADLAKLITQDELYAMAGYTLEQPFPLYKLLNAWSMCRANEKVRAHIGVFYNLLYRALEKLPLLPYRVNRGCAVNGVPALMETYQNHEERCKAGSDLFFWGFSSWSTKDAIATSTQFAGGPNA